jgi:hypothetical protein
MEALRLIIQHLFWFVEPLDEQKTRGYRLLPGQATLIPVYAIHRHRQLWDHQTRSMLLVSAQPATIIEQSI